MEGNEVTRLFKEFTTTFRPLHEKIITGWGPLSRLEQSGELKGLDEAEANRRRGHVFQNSVEAARNMITFVESASSRWSWVGGGQCLAKLNRLVSVYGSEEFDEDYWLALDTEYQEAAYRFTHSFYYGLAERA